MTQLTDLAKNYIWRRWGWRFWCSFRVEELYQWRFLTERLSTATLSSPFRSEFKFRGLASGCNWCCSCWIQLEGSKYSSKKACDLRTWSAGFSSRTATCCAGLYGPGICFRNIRSTAFFNFLPRSALDSHQLTSSRHLSLEEETIWHWLSTLSNSSTLFERPGKKAAWAVAAGTWWNCLPKSVSRTSFWSRPWPSITSQTVLNFVDCYLIWDDTRPSLWWLKLNSLQKIVCHLRLAKSDFSYFSNCNFQKEQSRSSFIKIFRLASIIIFNIID